MKTIACFALALCLTAPATAQDFRFYDSGPGLAVIMDTRGNYQYAIPLDPGRRPARYYVFGDDRRAPEVWLDLNTKTRENDNEEDETDE